MHDITVHKVQWLWYVGWLYVLQANEAWMTFTGPHGSLQLLLNEQDGVLVGPRPEKPPPMSQASTGEEQGLLQANGNALSEQLVRFLQSIGKAGSSF